MLAQQAPDFSATTTALTAALTVLLGLSVAVAKLVDFVRNLFDPGNNAPSWVWNVVAMVVGVGIALGWGINLLGALVDTIPALSTSSIGDGTWGTILTGLVMGGMAGFWHDKMAQWAAAHKRAVS